MKVTWVYDSGTLGSKDKFLGSILNLSYLTWKILLWLHGNFSQVFWTKSYLFIVKYESFKNVARQSLVSLVLFVSKKKPAADTLRFVYIISCLIFGLCGYFAPLIRSNDSVNCLSLRLLRRLERFQRRISWMESKKVVSLFYWQAQWEKRVWWKKETIVGQRAFFYLKIAWLGKLECSELQKFLEATVREAAYTKHRKCFCSLFENKASPFSSVYFLHLCTQFLKEQTMNIVPSNHRKCFLYIEKRIRFNFRYSKWGQQVTNFIFY